MTLYVRLSAPRPIKRIVLFPVLRPTQQQPGLGSIQFRNWNCSSIPIPIPIPELELELELKLVELKMELELKTLELELELELKTGIEFFAATAAITS